MSTEILNHIYKRYSVSEPIGIGDKGTTHSYLEIYGEYLKDRYFKKVNLLEIGVAEGHSLMMWKEYFAPDSLIMGVDIDAGRLKFRDNPVLFGNIRSSSTLDILKKIKFDIIIDDASHIFEDQIFAFENLKNQISEGGIYFIEDIVDIDNNNVYNAFKNLGFEIIDRRSIKNQPDDVIAVYKG